MQKKIDVLMVIEKLYERLSRRLIIRQHLAKTHEVSSQVTWSADIL